MNCTFNYFLT